MNNFIELTLVNEDRKILVNISLISQIVPCGDGTRLFFADGDHLTDVKENYREIRKMISIMISDLDLRLRDFDTMKRWYRWFPEFEKRVSDDYDPETRAFNPDKRL